MKKFVSIAALSIAAVTAQSVFAQANVAVLHLAPFASEIENTAVDININGTTTFTNVVFKDFVDYTELPAGDYTIDIVPVGATDPAITGNFTLEDGVWYSVAAIGNGTNQPLELLALVDNDGQNPADGTLNARIAHTAPFAATSAATEVSIRTDGGDLVAGLTGVPYKVDSGFLALPEGDYDLKVASNDGSVNYIDPDSVSLPAGITITLYAIGDGVNQPLSILAFPLGELAVSTPVDNSANGWWNISQGSGVGFILQPVASQDRLVGTWYDYDGAGNPVFFTFDSCLEDTDENGDFACSTPGAFDGVSALMTLYQSTGGGTAEGSVVNTAPVGTVEVEILGCDDAMTIVTIGEQAPVMNTATRLTRPLGCTLDQ